MKEEEKKRENLERAKTIMGRFDPALLSAALKEIMVEADEAEEADVAKAKEAIKKIYDSIPVGKDKKSIVSKAITELNSDIIEREVKVIKENLASIDKETIIEAAKDYVDIQELCKSPLYCMGCVGSITFCDRCVNMIACSICVRGSICGFCVGHLIICHLHCLYALYEYPQEGEIDPRIREQLNEEIIQKVLQRPELSRAMKKMFQKIQDEK